MSKRSTSCARGDRFKAACRGGMSKPTSRNILFCNPKKFLFVTQVENRVTKKNFWVTKKNFSDLGYKKELLGYKKKLFFIFYTKNSLFSIFFFFFFGLQKRTYRKNACFKNIYIFFFHKQK